MKKILFVINNLKIGGIQRSLIELLHVLDGMYDITLYCLDFTGDYISQIPVGVKVVKGNRYAVNPERSKFDCLKQGIPCFIYHCIIKGWSRLFGRRFPARIVCCMSGRIEGHYDYAISYAQPSNSHDCISLTNEMVLFNTSAEHKATFVHCDYGSYGGNTAYNHWLYSKFDKIAAVSESVRKKFVEILPDMVSKTIVVPNACNMVQIRDMANDNPVIYSRPAIVSVSRLGVEKGLDRCVPIFKGLIDDGFDIEWHIVGDGEDRNSLDDLILSHNMQNHIILEGMQSNPYRFMKNASCLFMPSFHEAAPMVFNEAACIGVPVLTTNTLSAMELVWNRHIGLVCENDEKSISAMLRGFLKDSAISIEPVSEVNTSVLTCFSNLCDTCCCQTE